MSTTANQAIVVHLAKSGKRIEVDAHTSILDAIEFEGIDVPSSCHEGVCGTCEARVLDGVPEHRDQVLTQYERNSNQSMMICCSRAQTPELTLDL
jgi:tetrachlorobenzoquinone reductase